MTPSLNHLLILLLDPHMMASKSIVLDIASESQLPTLAHPPVSTDLPLVNLDTSKDELNAKLKKEHKEKKAVSCEI